MNGHITSLANPLVKEASELKEKKYREQSGCFLLEGVKIIKEAFWADWPLDRLFICRKELAAEDFSFFAQQSEAKGVDFILTNAAVIKKIADAKTPQPAVAVAAKPSYTMGSISLPATASVVILDQIADPGNLGTIIRSADAFAISAIFLTKNCADVYSPKVLRSTMGSLFHLPIVTDCSPEEIIGWLQKNKFRLYAGSLDGQALAQADFSGRTAVVMGSEAHGVSAEFSKAAGNISIPMPGRAESLNVAMAAAIIMYQVAVARNKINML